MKNAFTGPWSEKKSIKLYIFLVLLLMLSLYCALRFPYYGEEGQYTLLAFGMRFYHNYIASISNGALYWRPPLYTWLIVFMSYLTGMKQVLLAARLVAISATVVTGFALWCLVETLFENRLFALMTTVIFFSGDLLFRHGWFAYSDPLFAFFIFAAIALTWVASVKQKTAYLALAGLCVIGGFLTKVLTIYVFSATALLVIAYFDRKNWRFFFKPSALIIYAGVLIFPFIWFHFAGDVQRAGVLKDFANQSESIGLLSYLVKLGAMPGELLLRTAPFSLLVLFLLSTKKWRYRGMLKPEYVKTAAWIVILSYLPYWLSPHANNIRYILPLYPLLALLFASVIWRCGERGVVMTFWLGLLLLLMKIGSSFWGLPWFEAMSWEYPAKAQAILNLTQGQTLYVSDTSSNGLSLVATIDARRWPQEPLKSIPLQWSDAFVLSHTNDPALGKLLQSYGDQKKHTVYLLCRGTACGGS